MSLNICIIKKEDIIDILRDKLFEKTKHNHSFNEFELVSNSNMRSKIRPM